jgi:hypothetical protein
MADRKTELEARTGLTSTPFSLLERATRDQRNSNPSILTVPVIACFPLCNNQIDYLKPPIATGQFRSVPGHWR